MLNRIFAKPGSFGEPSKNEDCDAFEINKWTLSEFVVKKLVPVVGIHPFPLDELMLMAGALCRFRPAYVFEWGTNIGKSARIFYETAKAFSISAHVHSIDLPDDVSHVEHPKNDRGKLVRGLSGVTLHQADGLTHSFKLLDELRPSGRVLFFVDGDHSYESVHREVSAILKRVPAAVILAHDTFYQSEGAGYNIGPFRAIGDALKEVPGNYRTVATSLGLPGMTMIYSQP
jgi:cephalosporin hydroxylase